ncbi:MAG TPA: hypothetical protein VJ783_18925 [Pirellulales bacterium]|nr:hypothetical protein [Pirellulales bacterium]
MGFWTPVEVAVRGGDRAVDARLILAAPDGDGVRTEFTTKSFTIGADVEQRVIAYVKFGRPESRMSVELVGEGETLDGRQFAAGGKDPDALFHVAYPSTQAMVLELGNPIGVEAAIGGPSGAADRTNVVHLGDAGELPDEAIGYEGVESLVISSSAPGIDEALAIGSPRLAALEEWIEQGGRLVLAVGDDAPRLLAADAPLGRLLPGQIGEASKLARLTAIEAFGGATLPRAAARGRQDEVVAVRLLDATGRIELSDGSFPLVVRAPRVFGEVAFAAVDLSRPPLAEWAGRRLFVKRLLRGRAAANRNEDDETATPPPTHLGLIDLSGQLRAALDQFRGVELAPFWLVAALAGVYIVLAGPADYFLLRALGRRMALTWITFPLLVVIFCGGAYWAAHRLKSERLIVNQVDLVDVDAASQKIRGTTWFNLFSPVTTTYDLSLPPHPAGDKDAPRQVWLSWQGLPGGALGGMEQTMAGPAAVARGYESSAERDELRGVPVPVWATKSFVANWQTTCQPGIDARLRLTADDVAEGRLTSRLEYPLRDCLLIAGRWAWQLGELAPRQTAAIVPGEQRDLQALLKDFKLVREQSRTSTVDVEVSTPYNPAGFDVRSILRQMMFYDANSGRRYTGLLNRYQHNLDFSNHLALGQAVLWGAAAEPASEVRDHGRPLSGPDDQHWTFYRYLLPVARE